MSLSNIFSTLYSLHTDINYTLYQIFIVLTLDEQRLTFKTVFTRLKTCVTPSTRLVWYTLIANSSERRVFRSFQLQNTALTFHKNQAVWRDVSKLCVVAPQNSKSNVKLHIWIRTLLNLPFLPPEMIKNKHEMLFERDAIAGSLCVGESVEPFKRLISYFKRYWIFKFQSKCGASTRTANERSIDVKVFITSFVRKYRSSARTTFSLLDFLDELATSRQIHL